MYYAVIDEEFCKVSKGAKTSEYDLNNEIIQIGAVLLDDNFNVIDKFNELVRPEYGHINAFIQKLTGISQYAVSQSDTLRVVLEKLLNWIPENTVMVSWSMNDESQLRREAEAKGLSNDKLLSLCSSWIDSQRMFTEKIDASRVYRLEEALNMSGILYDGNLHDGYSDAYNTALLFAEMQDEEFKPCSSYVHDGEETEELSFSLGNLFTGLGIA